VLTADLASVRRRGDELRLAPIDAKTRARLEALAAAYQAIARANVGRAREEVEAAFDDVAVAATERRLAGAVLKLVRDACVFEEAASDDAAALRRDLFRRASASRRATPPPTALTPALAVGAFDRAALVAEVARERGVAPDVVERGLFGDRAGAQRLLAVEAAPPARLAATFELAEAQAVLLRAVKLRALVHARDAATYRQLFRRLKFLRLLPTIEPAPGGGHHLVVDGPMSLFQAATRYGLQLALALPAIAACERWELEVDLLWGAERRPTRFRLSSHELAGHAPSPSEPPPLRDDVAALVAAFDKLGSAWRVDLDPAILDLPGMGFCVPDLAFERVDERTGEVTRVHLEALGFWSREAVFRRVDLVRAGLPHKILFAASRDLRVSEELLDDAPGAALYVYARVMNARAILERLDALADDARP
jgi:predicted nuclease of restriction endonuclease-like RecB superfamily